MLLSHWFARLRARLRVLSGGRLEREVDVELQFHLDQQISEYLEQGMSPKEACGRGRHS